MITCASLGSHGRLANQLFQYASSYGLAKKYGQELSLPEWKYAKYFQGKYPSGKIQAPTLDEKAFHYTEYPELESGNWNLHGYFQSEKYFEHCKDEIKEQLKWADSLKRKFKPHDIAIHIRRGDYVGNPNYLQLPISYYLTALQMIDGCEEMKILVLSDDMSYCRLHFGCLDNVTFANGNEAEDLCAMTMCKNFILSNSSYSWWGAWLGETEDSIVIRPNGLFDGDLLKNNDSRDFYPERWINHADTYQTA